MRLTIGSKITIHDPTAEVKKWCTDNLIFKNPEYLKKARMNLWLGNIPKTLTLYEVVDNDYIIPYGCLRSILNEFTDFQTSVEFKEKHLVNIKGTVPLFEYQKDAVKILFDSQYGILQSPAGSGKTQMAIALIGLIRVRTLWITHTKDLLNQSMKRACQYYDKSLMGTITEGKVNINTITFATVQTLSKLDLSQYKDTWDCIIIDECHRVSGTPTKLTMFSKVLNSLCARHKYGLSATVHRSDGLIQATYAMLGNIVYTVPPEAVADTVMPVHILPIDTRSRLHPEMLNTDGTLNYTKMISGLTEMNYRNGIINGCLIENEDHYNLILSDRVAHLKTLMEQLPDNLREQAVMIDGRMVSKTAKAKREQALEDMRQGKKHYLFATYSLAKEGLDIPRLDRLYLATPQKDYAVIVQSIGRVARTFENKDQPIVYDFVDNIRMLQKSYKTRCTTYRKAGCKILDWREEQ